MSTAERNFEITAAYFADYFFNRLYNIANTAFSRGGEATLTNEYITTVQEFVNALKLSAARKNDGGGDDALSRSIMKGFEDYHTKISKTSGIPHGEFVDSIVRNFILRGYFDSMQPRERDSFLCNVLRNIAVECGGYCLGNLRAIIDNRKDPRGPEAFQNYVLEIQKRIRNSLAVELQKKKTESVSTVSASLYESTRQTLVKQVERNAELSAQLLAMQKESKESRKLVEKLKAEIADLRSDLNQAREDAMHERTQAADSARIAREAAAVRERVESAFREREAAVRGRAAAMGRDAAVRGRDGAAMGRDAAAMGRDGAARERETTMKVSLVSDEDVAGGSEGMRGGDGGDGDGSGDGNGNGGNGSRDVPAAKQRRRRKSRPERMHTESSDERAESGAGGENSLDD